MWLFDSGWLDLIGKGGLAMLRPRCLVIRTRAGGEWFSIYKHPVVGPVEQRYLSLHHMNSVRCRPFQTPMMPRTTLPKSCGEEANTFVEVRNPLPPLQSPDNYSLHLLLRDMEYLLSLALHRQDRDAEKLAGGVIRDVRKGG